MMGIGNRIKSGRVRLGLTQGELGRLVNVEQSTVSGWESDNKKRRPQRDIIPKLADVLKVTPDWLEFGHDAGKHGGTKSLEGADPAELDAALLRECIRLSISSVISSYGLQLDDQRYDELASAAIDSYLTYSRLKDAPPQAAEERNKDAA